jgi:hypothetical protein
VLAAIRRAFPRARWVVLSRQAGDAAGLTPAAGRRRLDLPTPRNRATDRHWTGAAAADRRLARENPRWGDQRIKGALLRLGIRVSATAIRTTLRRHGLDPTPRPTTTTWRAFLRQQAAGPRLRLLHGLHNLAAAAVSAVPDRTGHPPGPPGRRDVQPRCCLGHPASPQPFPGDSGWRTATALCSATRSSVAGSTRCSAPRIRGARHAGPGPSPIPVHGSHTRTEATSQDGVAECRLRLPALPALEG